MNAKEHLMNRINKEVDLDGNDIKMMLKDIDEVSTFIRHTLEDVKYTINNKQFNTGGKKDLKIKKLYSLALYYFSYRDMLNDVEEMNVERYENENEYLKMCNLVKNFDRETVTDLFYHYLYGYSSGDIQEFIQKINLSLDILKNEIQLLYQKAKFKI